MANHLSRDEQLACLHLLVEGTSPRSVTRLTGVHRSSVMRLMLHVGSLCQELLDRRMRNLEFRHLRCDEIWTFVRKKQAQLKPHEAGNDLIGDQFLFVALDEATKLVPSFLIGKRTAGNAQAFMADLADRIIVPNPFELHSEEPPLISTDGFNAYADPNSYARSVQISHNLGNTTTATVFPTATVTSLGQSVQGGLTGGIGFWHNKNGQVLINAFNGGPDATALSSWLATNFPNLYGAGAGSNNLSGFSNAQVAAFYQYQLALRLLFESNVEAEVLATALNVYATTLSLGGTIGQAYGFNVTATGLGADLFNVGSDGAAFGVADNTTRNVYELLQAVDQQTPFDSLPYDGDTTLQQEASDLFGALNQAGAI